jgi:hypothetical protein
LEFIKFNRLSEAAGLGHMPEIIKYIFVTAEGKYLVKAMISNY